jgi:HSP20 family protein
MALIHWQPVRELGTAQNDVSRFLNSFFDTPTVAGRGALRRWVPATDLVETETDFVLRADLPGLSESEVNIEFDDNVLTISGERKSEHEDRKTGYYRVERSFGSFRRTLTLPEGVDAESIRATFNNGVLEVTVPKPAQRAPRKVQISVGAGSDEPQAIETADAPEAPAAA